MSKREPADTGRFASRLIQWQRTHGRHDLPWQSTRDPYRVWLSEVMLQQTQVSTVLRYYDRFLERFPTVADLAAAPEDDVLGLWSGLGYYSRARNLHRCAQQVMALHAGTFPRTAEELATLPGIGDSTAAAIAAFCFGQRISILDGNVRRVLTRWLGFGGDLAKPAAARALWDEAQSLLPHHPSADDMAAYTQGLMDLGATLCSRSRPACAICPMASDCVGAKEGDPGRYPVRTRRLQRRQERWHLLVAMSSASSGDERQQPQEPRLLLEKRPAKGIWASLHCVPVFSDDDGMTRLVAQLGGVTAETEMLTPRQHALTHRDLYLMPQLLRLNAERPDDGSFPVAPPYQWVPASKALQLGLPAPVRSLIESVLAS